MPAGLTWKWIRKRKNIFILGGGTMQKMDASSEGLKPVTFNARMKMLPSAEREYMFDNVYREEKARFYNVNMHGVDWDAMTATYRRLCHISTITMTMLKC